MNNLTFGDSTMGYYETIAGGAGAGSYWHGCSAVHTHMTNTRITDPEILEKRYPVILRQFSIRENSGGIGKYNGGNGVIRELEFTKPLIVSILSERRAFQPYGMAGGQCGKRGKNLLYIAKEDRYISLGGKNTIQVISGDRLIIESPGGGGYGTTTIDDNDAVTNHISNNTSNNSSGSSNTIPIMTSGSLLQYSLNQESV